MSDNNSNRGVSRRSADALILAVSRESQTLVPSLIQASKELDEHKKHEILLGMFKLVDTKLNEYEVHQKAYSETIIKNVVVGKTEDGKDIVKREIVKSRNIAHLIRSLNRESVSKMIQLLLVNVNNYFNIKEGLNEYQVPEIAEQIIDEYGDRLFIDELVYIFKKAKTSAKLYHALDGSIIFRWIDDHFKMKGYHQMKKDAEYKTSGYEIPQLPKGMAEKAMKKLHDNYLQNMVDMGSVTKPATPLKKKKKK